MNMEKWLTTVLACSALVLTACDGQSNNASAPADKVYRVGSNAEFAPFGPLDSAGKVEGFDVDLMNTIVKAGNFKIELKHQPWEGLFPSLNNGGVSVVMSGVIITDDHKQSMFFSDPYFEIAQVVLVPKGEEVASSEDLKNMARVGMITDYTDDFSVSKLLNNDNPKIARFEGVPLIIKELENDGLDSVVSDGAVIASYVKNNPTKGLNFIPLPDFTIENYGITARKDDEATIKMSNDALKEVRENGRYDKIYAKHFAREGREAERAEAAKQSGLASQTEGHLKTFQTAFSLVDAIERRRPL